jgi:hypothetical protein
VILSNTFVKNTLHFIFYLLLLSCLLNWLSRSPLERYVWGPITTWMVYSLWYIRQEECDSYETIPIKT